VNAPEQIYAVLVALQGDTLLLPNLAIAEVVSHAGLRPAADGAPPWFVGVIGWQGLEVPVASFEMLNQGIAEASQRRTRVAVFHTLSARLPSAHYGLLTEGYPHLVTLNRTAVRPEQLRVGDNPEMILSRVRVASTRAAIPNLDRIEERLAQALAPPAQ
jgi:chemosensory pili system protein ChpC